MSNIHIGGRIRELCESQNYTRDVLAEKVDISTKFMYEIEIGKKSFSSVEILSRIAVALLLSCDYIMFGKENGHYCNEL